MRSQCSFLLAVLVAGCTQSTATVGLDAGLRDAATPVDSAATDGTTRDASTSALCQLPPESGDCDGSIARYAFNPKTQACEKFIYGGCGGNGNNFERPLDCLAACVTRSDAGPQPAACKVGDQVFASGAGGIKDPHSCNTCDCQDGRLSCTEIACEKPCPPDRKAGIGCAVCGAVDNCELVDHGCFPVCDTSQDCQNTPYGVCLDHACKNVCG